MFSHGIGLIQAPWEVVRGHLIKVTLVCFFLAILLLARFYFQQTGGPCVGADGIRLRPSRLPFGIDIVYDIYVNINSHRSLEGAVEVYKKYGNTFKQCFMGSNFINTIDPLNIKAILSTHFSDYDTGVRRREASEPLLGAGIFNNDGADWRASRRLFRPAFKTNNLRNLPQLFEIHVGHLLKSTATEEAILDLSDLFDRLVLDISTHHFFGSSEADLVGKSCPDARQFHDAFAAAQDRIRENFILGKFSRFRPDLGFHNQRETVWRFVDRYAQKVSQNSLPSVSTTAITALARVTDRRNDPEKLRFELLHLLVAARDTTASVLSTLWLILSRRKDVWQEVSEEIRQFDGEHPTVETLRTAHYLNACILEGNKCIRTTTLPTGGGINGDQPVVVTAGTVVGWNTYALHRRVDIWGSDAIEFRPHRWLDNQVSNYEYIPFSGGPRKCLGAELALLEISYVTARLVQEFGCGLESIDPQPWTEKLTLTCCNLYGTKVRIVR